MAETGTPASRSPRRTRSIAIVFALSATLNVGVWTGGADLGFMGGMAEEHFFLGWNLHRTGSFAHPPRSDPYEAWIQGPTLSPVFRAPGYPAFVAAVLEIWGGDAARSGTVSRAEFERTLTGAMRAVTLAQALLLAATSAALCGLLLDRVRPAYAIGGSLAFGTSAYLIVHAGLLHYAVLHLAATVLATWSLSRALGGDEERPWGLVGAGLLWGVATLVRPTSLILPLVMAGLMRVGREGGRRAGRAAAWVALGMALVVGPYTLRNYAATGRVIPVNAQSNVALWGSTVKPLPRDPNSYRWLSIWYPSGVEIFERVSGGDPFEPVKYFRYVLPMEAELGREARRNLRARPAVYLRNVLTNVVTFTLDVNSLIVSGYRAARLWRKPFDARWLDPASGVTLSRSWVQTGVEWLLRSMGILALAGVIVAVRRRDPFWVAPAIGWATFLVAHAVTYMDFMYYYVKVPFLILFATYFLDAVHDRQVMFGRCRVSLGVFAGVAILAFSGVLSYAVLAAR